MSSYPSKSTDNKTKKENPAACIFVASLNRNLSDKDLNASVHDHFQQWGSVLNVKVLKDWLKRPYAFVQYENVQDCKVALSQCSGTILDGRSIRCEPARVNRSICLVSFNQPFNRQFLASCLSQFGEIEDITILQPNGKLNHVFVKFCYRADAVQAYFALKSADSRNKHNWSVEWASNLDINNTYGLFNTTASYRNVVLDKFSLFIGNLQDSVTEQELRQEFEKFGTVLNTHIVRKLYHRPSGQDFKKTFAFIRYQSETEAANAIQQKNGTLWQSKMMRVCYREHYNKKVPVMNCDKYYDCNACPPPYYYSRSVYYSTTPLVQPPPIYYSQKKGTNDET